MLGVVELDQMFQRPCSFVMMRFDVVYLNRLQVNSWIRLAKEAEWVRKRSKRREHIEPLRAEDIPGHSGGGRFLRAR